jgi:hypothetical protein
LRQPKLSFGRFGVPERALAGARDLCCTQRSTQGSNSLLNFAEFVLKFNATLMQSFYDVHEPSGSGLYPAPPSSERMNCERFGVDL